MLLGLFETRPDVHTRRAKKYLQQANIVRIEHETAAELAAMYTQRAHHLPARHPLQTGRSHQARWRVGSGLGKASAGRY